VAAQEVPMIQVLAFARTVQGAIILALSAVILALSLHIWGFNIGPIGFDGLTEKLEDCRANLDKATRQKNEQKRETERNIDKARDRNEQAEPKARRIETAPLPGGCATPKEIRELDI
jgi:uncharacterized protein HemX